MTTPAGFPSWTRTAESTTYGGHVNKQNYQQQGVTNPLTDIGAAEFLRTVIDLAASVNTAVFAMGKITCNDSSPDDPTIEWIRAQNASSLTPYAGDAPPAGLPTGTRVSDGKVTLQWDTTLTDAYGVSAAPAIIAAEARVNGYDTTVTITDSRTVTFTALNSGVAIADAVIEFWVY